MNDLRFGIRMLVKTPGFTLAVLATLALGIGVNTSIFSIANTILFSSLPYPESDRLVRVFHTWPHNDSGWHSVPNYLFYRKQNQVFEELAAYVEREVSLGSDDDFAERLSTMEVTSNFFEALRIGPELGRVFLKEEDQPGRDGVVVLSHGLWMRRFGGKAEIIGQKLRLDGEVVTVVGVMPARFDCPRIWGPIDAWRPFGFTVQESENYGRLYLNVFGRIKPGVALDEARAEMAIGAGRLAENHANSNRGMGTRLEALRKGPMVEASVLYFLIAVVAFVLLIGCANVANLQLVRTTIRQRELAIRSALGASRRRLLWQLLAESLILAGTGGALGLLLGVWSNETVAAYLNHRMAESGQTSIQLAVDGRVLCFTFLLSLLSGVIFGVLPALQGSRPELNRGLKECGPSTSAGRSSRRLRQILVIAEVATALVLLIGCGLAVRVIAKHLSVDAGFRTDHLLMMEVSLPSWKYSNPELRNRFFSRASEQLGALPGVRNVGVSTTFPIWKTVQTASMRVEGQPEPQDGREIWACDARVNAQFFTTLGIALKEGRDFTERDREGAPLVVIINETLNRQFWPGENAVGKRLYTYGAWREVVGIIGNLKHPGDLEAGGTNPQFYLPMAQDPWTFAYLVLHTAGQPETLADSARREIASVDPDLAVNRLTSVEAALRRSAIEFHLVGWLLGAFALLGLALAAVGIYGVVSFAAAQRANEIGIRMALGARRNEVIRLVLLQGMKLVGIGLAIGLVGALALTRAIQSLLIGVSPADPVTLAAVLLILAGTSALACYLPARRSARVDPIRALRYE